MKEYFRQRFIDELNDEGDITIRTKIWKRSEILEMAGDQIYNGLLVDWVEAQCSNARDQTAEFLTENRCLDRFEALFDRYRQGAVIPFIGAGMSCASGHKPWGEFLISLLTDVQDEIPDVDSLLNDFRYEEAAQRVHDILGADNFSHEIKERLGRHKKKIAGSVQLLPMIFPKLVVTTNFDYVLDNVYKQANLPFSDSVSGVYLADAVNKITDDPHCLLRLHGEAEVSHGRILTINEYDQYYKNNKVLSDLIAALTGTASLLFMGCSLNSDRTVSALKHMKEVSSINRPPHYAFLPEPEPQDRAERSDFLGQAGIRPIYYPPSDHDAMLEGLLIALKDDII
ncbi:SIR2 family protein [Acetobacter tropicalis]|uniref:Uncharacterized protein n=1 Tax=Acetobacter tropicalis TaxID=104102 RepID=A0A251ZZU0_9PROT|nr:SIR2 family protein [Acetobacter tropicalis]OUI80280.1 hypothetical protein HC62_17945 [Acetobacter tropicalis]